jgi:hypothetical protein
MYAQGSLKESFRLQTERKEAMRINLKALGLALFAAFAMSAFVAQAASAVNHEFEVTEAPAVSTGVNTTNHVLLVSEGFAEVICKHATFVGTQAAEVQDRLSVYPTYSECSIPGVGGATVTNNGCTYDFDSDTVVSHAPVSLDCDHKGSITVVAGGGACTIHFSDTHTEKTVTVNQNLVGVVYKNEELGVEKHAVEVVATVTGVTYEATGGFCELLGVVPGTNHDGEVKGSATVQAFEDTGGSTVEGNHVFTHNDVDVGATIKLNTAG